MTTTRRHHFVSQFYLANFADPNKPGQLNVLNVDTGVWFSTAPKNVGVETDFNRVERIGAPIDALESALAQFEGEAAAALKRTVESKSYPSDEDLNYLLNMIGLYHVRNPRSRSAYLEFKDRSLRTLAHQIVRDPDIFASITESARDAGELNAESVSYEKVKQFVESNQYTIDVSLDSVHNMEFQVFDDVLPILGQRHWSLLTPQDDICRFITSDHPVVITPKEPPVVPVGLGTKETELIFPLSPELLLYGVFETPLKKVVAIPASRMAAFNTRILFSSLRHAFSSEPRFIMRRNGQEVFCANAA